MGGNMKALLVILLTFSLIPASLGYTLGGTTFKGDVDMYGNNLSNLTTPVLDSDAATKAYADAVAIGGGLPTAGGTMTGQIDFGGIPGYNISTPVNDSDVSTKKYVDDAVLPFAEIEPSQLNYSLPFSSITMDAGSTITLDGGSLLNSYLAGFDAIISVSGDTAYCRDNDGVIVNSSTEDNKVFYYALSHYDHIRCMSGHYYFNSTLNSSNREFTLVLDPNAIIHKGDGLTGTFILLYGPASYPLVIGGQIDGEDNSVDGIRLQESIMQDRLRGVEIFNCDNGLRYYNSVYSTSVYDLYIHDCNIGVLMDSFSTGAINQNKIKDCVINSNGYGVVIRSRAEHNIITDCSIENSDYWAVNIESEDNTPANGPYGNEIYRCWIEGAGHGIKVNMSASNRQPKCNSVEKCHFVGDLTESIEFYNESAGVRNRFISNTLSPSGSGAGELVYLSGAIWSICMWNTAHGRTFELQDSGTGTVHTTNWC